MTADVVVVGGGISGLSFACFCAKAGRSVLVLEADAQAGGCLRTQRLPDGFWWELGAHTGYNSYGALLSLLEERGALGRLRPRAKVPFRLVDAQGRVRSVAGALGFGELLLHAPRLFFEKKEGRTVREYYSALAGPRNYGRLLGPMFAAVPSQPADDFPADMLFKKRTRRKDVLRSWTFDGGLQGIAEVLAATPGVTVRTGAAATAVTRRGDGFSAALADGTSVEAARIATAVPPPAAAGLLRAVLPEVAAALDRIATQEIATFGVSVACADTPLAPAAGLVPVQDVFYSAVTRDVVPDGRRRGFAFHCRPGTREPEARDRIATLLRMQPDALGPLARRTAVLPSPRIGHRAVADAIARGVQGTGVFVVGNYFGGLAIEDCVLRARDEADRFAAAG